MVLAVTADLVVLRNSPQAYMQIGREFAHELQPFVEAPDVKDVVVKAPGQAIVLVRFVEKGFVHLGIPTTQDGLLSAPAVELLQDLEQGRCRGNHFTVDVVDFSRAVGVFDVARIGQGLKILDVALPIGLKDAADLNDAMPLGIESGSFQIDED